MRLTKSQIYVGLGLLCMVAGCSDREVPVREYTEIHVMPPPATAAPMADPHTMGSAPPMASLPAQKPDVPSTSFSWRAPDGWSEETGTGMRLATLRFETDGESGECTIIELSGDSGSLEANIRRWLGQVQLAPSDAELRAYMEALPTWTADAELDGYLIDFAPFVSEANAPSTLAAIIGDGQKTLFLKLTGSARFLEQNREAFIELAHSVTRD